MITLGINAAFHDSSAALVVDGVLVAAAEEERFTRIKHGKRPVPFTAWELPFHAIAFCLERAGITLAELDHVAYSFDPKEFLDGRDGGQATLSLPLEPSAHDKGHWESPWDPLFAAYVMNAPRQFVDGAPHHLRERFAGGRHENPPYRWHFVNHHLCHQASAFLASPFERCAVMTIDGRGERASTTYGAYRENRYESLGEVLVPSSLGLLYERVTSYLGFLHSSDEYKVMALAALGSPRYAGALQEQIRMSERGQYAFGAIDLEALCGPARRRGGPLEQRHFDLTASLQKVLEATVLDLAAWLRETSGERRLAMAGGVALNCVMNARLRDAGVFDEVWVQPAAGDAGTALGAALWIDALERSAGAPADDDTGVGSAGVRLGPREWTMEHAYLGPDFDDETIEQLLRWAKLPYRRLGDTEAIAEATAELLERNAIIGWFQGRMEFGPRALGARSILASPIDPAMQAQLNELKDREDFRPVAPAVLQEALTDWFSPAAGNGGTSPFMLFVYEVAPGQSDRIPSACHTDRSARVQTVSAGTNARFHALLRAFGRRTGVPVLVNTSFNVRGQPIVCTPRDAIEAFFSTPLDALVIGSFLVTKMP
jgi:carbamoyltransferase